MYPSQDTITALKFARMHEAELTASYPRRPRRFFRRHASAPASRPRLVPASGTPVPSPGQPQQGSAAA